MAWLRAHRDLTAIGVITLVITGVFSRTLFLGQVFLGEDVGAAFFPWFAFLARARLTGDWLPWCPDVGCGFPLWSNGQSGAFYAPNLLSWLPVRLTWTFAFLCMAHCLSGAIGMYLLARRFRLRRLGSIVAGLTFALTGFLIAHQNHYSMANAASWTPWLALGLCRWTTTRSPWAFVLAALSLQAAWLNHPQPPLHMSVFALACVWLDPTRVLAESRPSPGASIFRLIFAALPLIVGTMLAGLLIWPTLQLTRWGAGSARQGYEFMTTCSLPPLHLITFVLPNFFGGPWHNWGPRNHWEICGYVGGITLLSILAVGGRAPATRRLYCGLVVLAALALLLAFGGYTPLYHALQHVPVLNRFRCPGRWLLCWSAAMALLGGLAVHDLAFRLRQPTTARRLTSLFAGTAACAGGVGAGVWFGERPTRLMVTAVRQAIQTRGLHLSHFVDQGLSRLYSQPYENLRMIGGDLLALAAGAAVVAIALWLGGRGRLHHRWLPRVVAAVIIAQACVFAWHYWPPWPAEALLLPSHLANVLPHDITEGRLVQGYAAGTPWDLIQGYEKGGRWDLRLLGSNSNLLCGVPVADIYDPLNPPVVSLISQLGGRRLSDPVVAAALGGSAILTDLPPRDYPKSMSAATVVPCGPGKTTAFVYRNPQYRGLAWTVSRTTSAAAAKRQLEDSNASAGFMRDAPWISPEPSCSRTGSGGGLSRRAEVLEWSGRRILVRVAAGSACSLVVSSANMPGWTAAINGAPAPLAVANGAFCAVELPAAACQVELRYTPFGFRTGLLISMCGALLGAALLLVVRPRNDAAAGER